MFKPHYGKCKCHPNSSDRLIVVKAGYCSEGNEAMKIITGKKKPKDKEWNKVFKNIPRVSDKRKKLDAAYSALRKSFMQDHPYCAANIKGTCNHLATDVHHLYWAKDREKYMNDFSQIIPVCRPCHTYIHSVMSKTEAIERRFKKLDNEHAT